MRIKKLLIVGTLALATTGCVSAYTYAATPNNSTESSIDTSKDSAKIKADSESKTEAKENADENTKKDVKSEKNDFEDNESTEAKETTDDSENEDVNVDESEDVTEPYEVIQDGDENDIICEHTWGAEQGGYDSEKGYFYWKECTKCGQQKIDRYVSEEEFLKNDPDYNEPAKDTNTTETDDSVDSNTENNVITTENNN